MTKLIFLDIDGVLMPWKHVGLTTIDAQASDTLKAVSGFTDWTRVEKPYWTFYSPEQHRLIQEVGQVVWLTTWARHPDMLDDYSYTTGFGPFDAASSVENERGYSLYSWWKLGWALDFAESDSPLWDGVDEVIWVDDDHSTIRGGRQFGETVKVAEVIENLHGVKTEIIRPEVVWTREQIEAIRDY